MKNMNWAIDDGNDLNPPINLSMVESFNLGVADKTIEFKFLNNPPVKWYFITNEQKNEKYQELLKMIEL